MSKVLLWLSVCLILPGLAMAQDTDTAKKIEKTSERGPVKATVTLQPADPVIGDALTLTLQVIAEPGVELLMPEFGQALDRFSILDFLPREAIDAAGRTVATQRYTLQPPLSGEQQIPPIMIEFVDRRPAQQPAPEDEDAYELLTERLLFSVASVTPSSAAEDLQPPLGELAPIAVARPPLWPWLLAVMVILLAAAPLVWRFYRTWRTRARRRSAFDVASTRLQGLLNKPRPDADMMKPFFIELSAIVRQYLENRFALHAPELTTEEFLEVASGSPDLTQQHRLFLRDFLQSADQVKFARYIPDAGHAETALTATASFLEQTRERGHADKSVTPETAHA
jgi:hypothetical protein